MFFGFVFIVSQLYPALFIKKSYNGVICDIDRDSKKAVVRYEKRGEKCSADFRYGKFSSDSGFSIDFSAHIGMEVSIVLDANDHIQYVSIPKNKNVKKKISWGILSIGLLMFGYGLYKFILLTLIA
jgi:hypothetical protein